MLPRNKKKGKKKSRGTVRTVSQVPNPFSFQDKDEGKVNTVHSIPAPWKVPSVYTGVPDTVLWRVEGQGECVQK